MSADSISKNLAFIRSASIDGAPDFGAKLYETLYAIVQQQQQISQQVNGSPTSQPVSPPTINNVTVTGQNGHFNIAIRDNNPNLYRGIRYYAEYDSSPSFSNPKVIPMGDSRNHNEYLGNGTYYWRAYSSYVSSPPSSAVYHGTQVQPIAVSGGGDIGGPLHQDSQGSGTGAAGQGLQGPGTIPFRGGTGKPPTR